MVVDTEQGYIETNKVVKHYTWDKLKELTVKWSYDRGILTNGKAVTQCLKLVSEKGELDKSIATDKDFRDDIGDMLVVICNLSQLVGFKDLAEHWSEDLRDRDSNILLLGSDLGKLCDMIIKGQDKEIIGEQLSILIVHLASLCEYYGTTMEDCWSIAYHDIKDRKGFLNTEGTFIKSTDDNYEQLLMEFKNAK